MSNSINWKVFAILLSLSLISVVCVFPYVLTLQKDILQQINIPIGLIFAAQLMQSLILFAVTIFMGLWLANKIGFHLPLIHAIITKANYRKILDDILGRSIFSGVIIAILIYATDIIFSKFGAVISTHQNYVPVWQKLLAAVYGGISEEILLRLFLMSLLIWIGTKLLKQKQPTRAVIMISILLSSIIFGLGHLPVTASLTALTPIVIVRAIVLNGIGGVVFGWLFWKKGLESAMIAHFTADIFLLTILPQTF